MAPRRATAAASAPADLSAFEWAAEFGQPAPRGPDLAKGAFDALDLSCARALIGFAWRWRPSLRLHGRRGRPTGSGGVALRNFGYYSDGSGLAPSDLLSAPLEPLHWAGPNANQLANERPPAAQVFFELAIWRVATDDATSSAGPAGEPSPGEGCVPASLIGADC